MKSAFIFHRTHSPSKAGNVLLPVSGSGRDGRFNLPLFFTRDERIFP